MAEADSTSLVASLIAGRESYYVEFKSAYEISPDGRRPRDLRAVAVDIGETLVAFANADGGDLLIGVEDDGTVTGIPWDENRQLYLVQARKDQILGPDIGGRVERVQLGGQAVLWFRIEAHEGDPVVTASGRCLRRRSDRNEPIPPGEVRLLREHARGELTCEADPRPLARVEDLDLAPVWDLARGLRRRDAPLPGSPSDPLPLLRYWNLVEQRNGQVVLRNAALLLFARDPLRWHANNRLRVRYAVGDGPGVGRELNTREIEIMGPIARILDEGERTLILGLERSTLQGRLFQTETLLPAEALRECLVNAAVHRNYAIQGQAVEVLFLPDRLEFRSPGRLPDAIRLEDLRMERGVHRSRNPIIMRVLRDLGWTRDEGEGIRRIFASMRQVDLSVPDLSVEADTFIVRLSTRSIYDEETRAWLAAYGPFGIRPQDRRLLVALRNAGGRRSVDRLARALGLPFDEVKRALADLDSRGFVWHAARSRTFTLVEPTNVLHERALRRLQAAKLEPTLALRLDLDQVREVLGAREVQRALREVEAWKIADILVPSGPKQWRLGNAFILYAAARGALTAF